MRTKKVWKVPVTWEVYGVVEVDAETKEEAIKIVMNDEDDVPLPTESYYIDGSFRVSTDDLEELKAMVEEA